MIKQIKDNYPLILLFIIGSCFYASLPILTTPSNAEKMMLELKIELTKLNIKKLKGECKAI
tara:strand:- start:8 stop:190 length:183 start_codon:yes stop_codon:yes gene_type:complete